mmetsp:Transcript_24115/g.51834  ORF Transcript_24115/g.51834 Transcript_24115/m.51834 type:complete len:200 (-) Transcript_24115:260-859(-)
MKSTATMSVTLSAALLLLSRECAAQPPLFVGRWLPAGVVPDDQIPGVPGISRFSSEFLNLPGNDVEGLVKEPLEEAEKLVDTAGMVGNIIGGSQPDPENPSEFKFDRLTANSLDDVIESMDLDFSAMAEGEMETVGNMYGDSFGVLKYREFFLNKDSGVNDLTVGDIADGLSGSNAEMFCQDNFGNNGEVDCNQVTHQG